jgi:hypothetical protein
MMSITQSDLIHAVRAAFFFEKQIEAKIAPPIASGINPYAHPANPISTATFIAYGISEHPNWEH